MENHIHFSDLQKITDWFKKTINSPDTGTFEWDVHDNLFHWDNTLLQIFEISPDSDSNITNLIFNTIHKNEREAIRSEFLKAISADSEEELFELEFQVDSQKGIRNIGLKGLIIRNESKEPLKVYFAVNDINFKTESTTFESETLLRTVFDQQFQFMAILSPEGKVLKLNDFPFDDKLIDKDAFLGKYYWEGPFWDGLSEWKGKIQKQVLQSKTMHSALICEDIFQSSEKKLFYTITSYTAIRNDKNEAQTFLCRPPI